jgi:hypothetical protein
MTSKLQKPSHSWKKGVDHRSNFPQLSIVAVSTNPSLPRIQSRKLLFPALFPLNVLDTHPPV